MNNAKPGFGFSVSMAASFPYTAPGVGRQREGGNGVTDRNQTHASQQGLPPGTMVFVGKRRVAESVITVLDYDAEHCAETVLPDPEACRAYLGRDTVTWINVTGLHDTALLAELGGIFSIHPLALEDIVNTGQRPKLETYGDTLFLVLKMLYRGADGAVAVEQVSFLLGRTFVLSFQELEGDVFGRIRDRIRTSGGRIRRMGSDYLAYCLLDAIVDHYFVLIEDLQERIEVLQDAVLERCDSEVLQAIHALKREMIVLRRNLWPLREVVSGLERDESGLLGGAIAPYLRDVYEHTIQVLDTIDAFRDTLTGVLDMYMSMVSNRMNDVMKTLTVIATIFIPLTFIAGVYGMNFRHMPELEWRFGYAAALGIMALTGLAMALHFKRKRWW
jgi:magnesium transporter